MHFLVTRTAIWYLGDWTKLSELTPCGGEHERKASGIGVIRTEG
jgi:Ser-tRNA(Ala) deacylase AlaX